MNSTDRIFGSIISCSEAAIIQVTFWNFCCSSMGVSIKFHSSNMEDARSWSCNNTKVHKCVLSEEGNKKSVVTSEQFNHLHTCCILSNLTSRSLPIAAAKCWIVSLLIFFVPSDSPRLGWTSLTVCLKSIPRTEHSEFKVLRWSKTCFKRSVCRNRIVKLGQISCYFIWSGGVGIWNNWIGCSIILTFSFWSACSSACSSSSFLNDKSLSSTTTVVEEQPEGLKISSLIFCICFVTSMNCFFLSDFLLRISFNSGKMVLSSAFRPPRLWSDWTQDS